MLALYVKQKNFKLSNFQSNLTKQLKPLLGTYNAFVGWFACIRQQFD